MGPPLLLLLFVTPSLGASVYFVDEDDQTLAFPIRKGSVRNLEDAMLNLLGMEEHIQKMENRHRAEATVFMKGLYDTLQRVPHPRSELEKAEMILAISPEKIVAPSTGSRDWRVLLTLEPSLREASLSSATLHFRPSPRLASVLTRLTVYLDSSSTLQEVGSFIPGLQGSSMATINVTSIIHQWQSSQSAPEIVLSIEAGDAPLQEEDWSVFVLSLFSSTPHRTFEGRKRRKRSVEEAEGGPRSPLNESPAYHPLRPKGRRPACKRHGLYIDFTELGWNDWVIAPMGYQAEYCMGACSFPLHARMNATNHALVQTLVHQMSPGSVSEPKCAPLSLSPVKILFKDTQGNVQIKTYQGMGIENCGCQ